ncbi:hypothetical protein EJB05_29312, partial [Eragrostis curvula]
MAPFSSRLNKIGARPRNPRHTAAGVIASLSAVELLPAGAVSALAIHLLPIHYRSGSPSNYRVQIRRWRRCSGTRLRGRVLWSGSETSTITSASRAHLHGGADLGRAGGSISTFKNLKMGGAPEDYTWRQSRKKY